MSEHLKSEDMKNQAYKEDESESEGGNGSNSRTGNARPLANRFPQDPELAAAFRYHKDKWEKTVLPAFGMALGVRTGISGHSL